MLRNQSASCQPERVVNVFTQSRAFGCNHRSNDKRFVVTAHFDYKMHRCRVSAHIQFTVIRIGWGEVTHCEQKWVMFTVLPMQD
jgi:hypothetical protein